MKTLVFVGPGKSRTTMRGFRAVTFEAGVPQEVDDGFAAELLGLNPEGHTLEQAALYGTVIFKEASGGAGAPTKHKGSGEEVGS